uniref:Uncharacterized protein n=1 Tax=Arundo donax TaxID=35708 RepID=A0A0A9GQ86_ARUDO
MREWRKIWWSLYAISTRSSIYSCFWRSILMQI